MKKFFYAAFFLFFVAPIAAGAAGVPAQFDRDLFFGMRGDSDVSHLQQFLAGQELYAGPVSGNFFSLTKSAVKKFQERERIAPSLGYFGTLTRARANEILMNAGASVPGSAAQKIAGQIALLQAQLKLLQDKLAAEQSASSSAATSTPPAALMPAPVFTKAPQVVQAGFVANPAFGAHYPYRVSFDWATDATGPISESVSCAPALKIGASAGHATKYFPEPHAAYSCTARVENQQGKSVSADFSFATPWWISVAGSTTAQFPDAVQTPLKLGELALYNGSTSDILFSSFDTILSDSMDSTPNRGRKISFLLRNGTTSTDTLISQTDFTLLSTAPSLDQPYRAPVNIPVPVILSPGETRTMTFWIEQLQYVRSGTLELAATKVNTAGPVPITGLFDFILTRVPGL